MKSPRRERNLKFIDGRWYLDFTFHGKRIRQFGGYTKDQARNTLAKLRMDKFDESRGLKRPGKDVSFTEFADDFLNDYCKQNKRSWQRDELSLNKLKAFFKGESLQSIGNQQIERYKAARKAEVSPATVNRELACLKTLFNKATEWGKAEKNPAAKIRKFREANARERILSPDEARRLIDSSSAALRPVLIVALGTGMRKGEILSLKWANVDFGKSVILIETSKSGKPRKVPMNAFVYETLKALPRDSEFVFYNPETKTHLKGVERVFRAACKEAEIQGLRLHDCRHSFATWYMENGGDIVALSKILGHASIQMTVRYCNPTWETMRSMVGKLGDILDPTRQKVDTSPEGVVAISPATPLGIAN